MYGEWEVCLLAGRVEKSAAGGTLQGVFLSFLEMPMESMLYTNNRKPDVPAGPVNRTDGIFSDRHVSHVCFFYKKNKRKGEQRNERNESKMHLGIHG